MVMCLCIHSHTKCAHCINHLHSQHTTCMHGAAVSVLPASCVVLPNIMPLVDRIPVAQSFSVTNSLFELEWDLTNETFWNVYLPYPHDAWSIFRVFKMEGTKKFSDTCRVSGTCRWARQSPNEISNRNFKNVSSNFLCHFCVV